MKIVFFGTPEFAAKHLQVLHTQGIDIAAIVTKPDTPQGRHLVLQPPPVKVYAQKYMPHVPLYQPEKCSTAEFAGVLTSLHADLYVVVAYGEIIKQNILDIPRLGCINVHGSLLPHLRGAAPMQRCLLQGDTTSGVTIIQLVLKMDAGDMLHQGKVAVPPNMTLPELEKALIEAGCRSLLKVLTDFERAAVVRTPQDETKVTFAPKITPAECCIDWNKQALVIHNLVRAVTPHPGAWCPIYVRGQTKRLKILRSECVESCIGTPGTHVQYSKNELLVFCGKGGLRLQEVQLEGKAAMPIEELLRGLPLDAFTFIC